MNTRQDMKKQSKKRSFLSMFRKEAEMHIQELDKGLLVLEDNPKDRNALEEIRRRAHTLKGSAKMMGFAEISDTAHSMEDLLEGVKTESSGLDNGLFDRLFTCLDSIRGLLRRTSDEESPEADAPTTKVSSEISEGLPTQKAAPRVVESPTSKITDIDVQDAILVETDRLDSLAGTVSEMVMDQIKSESQTTELSHISDLMRQQFSVWAQLEEKMSLDAANERAGIPVTQGLQREELNRYYDLSISILNSMINLLDDYRTIATHRKLLIDRLQEDIRSIRLIPISVVFDSFPRAVRDMGKEYGKNIKLDISGGEVKLDKSIIETIRDPLMHLVRNAVDHGIEDTGDRMRRAKPRTGHINLSAYHRGSKVVIEISDDGAGINLEKVKQSALQKGYIEESRLKTMDEQSAVQLIFLPGISTSPIITDVSGRGVGMDVVMENIGRKLKGMIDVQTEPGKGTTISLVVPITLAVMQVLVVRVGQGMFAIPTETIKKNVRLTRDQIRSVEGKQAVIDDEGIVPLVKLGDILGFHEISPENDGDNSPPHKGTQDNIISAFILEHAQRRIAFCVDDFVSEEEVVIKSLGSYLKKARYTAGATILGTGEVVAILHTADLLNSAGDKLAGAAPVQLPEIDREESEKLIAASILVVDDSLTTRELERSILEASGYDVHVAVDGLDGLNKISKRKFDLIISDVEMPRMNGFQMVETLKQNDHSKDIPVIMVTALQKDEEKRRGMEVGASAYIVKSSFDQSNLLETIQTLIGQ